jgi:hypothetical protein
MYGKGMGHSRNNNMSGCVRKELLVKRIKMRNCIVDKMGWVSQEGIIDMEKIKSCLVSSSMGDMFMTKGVEKIHKCMKIIDIVEVEQRLMSMIDVKMCQKDEDIKAKAHDLNRSDSVTVRQGKGKDGCKGKGKGKGKCGKCGKCYNSCSCMTP